MKFEHFSLFLQKSRHESISHDTLERGVSPQGVRLIKDQSQTASQRTCEYADLDFTDDRPGPTLSQEKVTYTEVGNKPVSVCLCNVSSLLFVILENYMVLNS